MYVYCELVIPLYSSDEQGKWILGATDKKKKFVTTIIG